MTEHIYETCLVKQNGWEIYFPKSEASPKEEIIRCRDCVNWWDEGHCVHWQTLPNEAPCTMANDFCSYAEKKVN